MKKTVTILLILTMALGVFCGCSGTTLSGDDKGAQISMSLTGYPYSLDPAVTQVSADSLKIFGLVYEGLTVLKKDGGVSGGLAYEWYDKFDSRSQEYKMYFKIRSTKWSDGRAVSADDIIYAWKRILKPGFESPYASLLYPIKNAISVKSGMMTSDDLGLKAVDDKLLEITFECDYDSDLFAETVASPGLVALPEDVMSRNKDTWYNTSSSMTFCGPFRIQAMDRDYRLVLERNSYYCRDEEDDPLDESVLPHRIYCYYSTYDKTSLLSYEDIAARFGNSELFFISDFNAATYAQYASDIKTQNMLSTFTYFFNTSNPVLEKSEVRKALSEALDRTHIASLVGCGQVAATGFVPTGVFNTSKKNDFREAGGALYTATSNMDAARTLLSQAGVSSGSFAITYLDTNDSQKLIAEYAASVWNELGFSVTLNGVKAADYYKAISTAPANKETSFDVIGMDYSINSTDALAFLAPFAKKYSGSYVSIDLDAEAFTPHFTGFAADDYDALVDSIAYVSDRTQRAELTHQLETMFVNYCPATALYFNTSSYVASGKLSGYKTEYFGYMNFDRASLSGYKAIKDTLIANIEAGEAAIKAAQQ